VTAARSPFAAAEIAPTPFKYISKRRADSERLDVERRCPVFNAEQFQQIARGLPGVTEIDHQFQHVLRHAALHVRITRWLWIFARMLSRTSFK